MELGKLAPRRHVSPVRPGAPRAAGPRFDTNGSALARHFLARLERLAQIRQTEAERLTDEGIHLLDRTIYSSLCDCIDAGAGEVARVVLQSALVSEDAEHTTVPTPVGRLT